MAKKFSDLKNNGPHQRFSCYHSCFLNSHQTNCHVTQKVSKSFVTVRGTALKTEDSFYEKSLTETLFCFFLRLL